PAVDAVLKQSTEALPATTEALPSAKLDWLYEFEQTTTKHNTTRKSTPAEKAVDLLLAADWD
ncbi:hypothetical protein LCGC14_2842250, partial [marine sediment metagenome]